MSMAPHNEGPSGINFALLDVKFAVETFLKSKLSLASTLCRTRQLPIQNTNFPPLGRHLQIAMRTAHVAMHNAPCALPLSTKVLRAWQSSAKALRRSKLARFLWSPNDVVWSRVLAKLRRTSCCSIWAIHRATCWKNILRSAAYCPANCDVCRQV